MVFYQVGTVGGADVSAVTYFAPILAFLIVFIVMFLILRKTKVLGENNPWVDTFVSFLIAIIFVTAASVRQVVLNVVPWFAVLVMALFFILVLAGFIGKQKEIAGKGLGWIFVILAIVIFVVAGVKVFSGTLWPYLPGPAFGAGVDDPGLFYFLSWLYSPRVIGAILLIIAAAVTSWVLVRFGGKK